MRLKFVVADVTTSYVLPSGLVAVLHVQTQVASSTCIEQPPPPISTRQLPHLVVSVVVVIVALCTCRIYSPPSLHRVLPPPVVQHRERGLVLDAQQVRRQLEQLRVRGARGVRQLPARHDLESVLWVHNEVSACLNGAHTPARERVVRDSRLTQVASSVEPDTLAQRKRTCALVTGQTMRLAHVPRSSNMMVLSALAKSGNRPHSTPSGLQLNRPYRGDSTVIMAAWSKKHATL